MSAAYVSPPKKISKTTLSMFLRTRCDKELFLSLHEEKDLKAAGMPIPLTRAGIGRLSVAGQEFEKERNAQLIRMLGTAARHVVGPSGAIAELSLASELSKTIVSPSLLLQPKFTIDHIRSQVLLDLGLSAAEVALIPSVASFKPDVLIVRDPESEDREILKSGNLAPIDMLTEIRQALVVLDVKHTSEANASYCSEIAMYALMLAHWLADNPKLAARFYVVGSGYIWSRKKIGDAQVDKLAALGGGTPTQVIQALLRDAEDAYLRQYLPVVRRFFENVARVIAIADVSNTAWQGLEWHVAARCGSCDWLGDRRHVNSRDQLVIDANPNHYCTPRAKNYGHLSLVPGITLGAKKTLEAQGIPDAPTLALSAGHVAFQHHTVLKREARTLPDISNAILANTLSGDPSVRIASLDDYPQLKLYVAINFDPSSGLLTGLSLGGSATTYTTGVAPRRFTPTPFIVDQKTSAAEWTALSGFLNQIAQCILQAETFVGQPPTGQIHFWDRRQFQELCHGIGRHLPQVMGLAERKARSLAWLFPPDELLTHPDALEASTVACISEIVQRAVFTPTPHSLTLFGTSEHYASGPVFTERDSYYREYLTDGIPRERIYEIWSNDTSIPRGSAAAIPRNTAIARYAQTLERQVRALESVCERLRIDYKGQFHAKAPRIPTSIPRGTPNVAIDSKMWIWWDKLDFQATQLEGHIRLGLDGERLEATYEAIILLNGRQVAGNEYEFDIPATSLEAKFTEDSMLTLGKLGRPGLPLERAHNFLPANPPYIGPVEVNAPLWSILEVHLLALDRNVGKARVRFSCYRDSAFAIHLLRHSTVDLLDQVFLLESKSPKPFNWALTSTELLEAIGTPAVAIPDPNAVAAMGITPPRRRPAASPVTPAAEVLWNAGRLEKLKHLPTLRAKALSVLAQARYALDPSQAAAVEHAAERALTLIWGPPGTGKTKTLTALIHEAARDAVARKVPLKILVSGPTYKAVLQLLERYTQGVSADPSTPCRIWMGYSASRGADPAPTGLPGHVRYKTFLFADQDPEYQACVAQLRGGTGVTIVGSHIRQPRRFAQFLHGAAVGPVFDMIVLDESSQIPVSHSISALVTMAAECRLVIAGDQLQMPPIAALDPPDDAKYMVGSIQRYLINRQFTPVVDQCPLETNYRSAEPIVEYLRRIGYRKTLTAAYPGTSLRYLSALPKAAAYPPHLPSCPDINELLDPKRAIVTFLHTDETSSQGNLIEAQFVAALVWALRMVVSAELDGQGAASHAPPIAKTFWARCVGVVTPHKAQRALIVRELQALFPAEGTEIQEAVDTVERFQGGERHTIIITFGVADVEVIAGEETFLMQQERMNVAVSRAQAKCIVLMPETLASHIPEDHRALETSFAVKEYVESYCDARLPTTLVAAGTARTAQIRYPT